MEKGKNHFIPQWESIELLAGEVSFHKNVVGTDPTLCFPCLHLSLLAPMVPRRLHLLATRERGRMDFFGFLSLSVCISKGRNHTAFRANTRGV